MTVGVGVVEAWEARNARFDIAWVSSPKFATYYNLLISII